MLSQLSEGTCQRLDLGLLVSSTGERNVCCLRPPGLWDLVMAAPGDECSLKAVCCMNVSRGRASPCFSLLGVQKLGAAQEKHLPADGRRTCGTCDGTSVGRVFPFVGRKALRGRQRLWPCSRASAGPGKCSKVGLFPPPQKRKIFLPPQASPGRGEEVALRVTWGVAEGSLPVVGGWTTPMTLNPGARWSPGGRVLSKIPALPHPRPTGGCGSADLNLVGLGSEPFKAPRWV